MKTDLFLACGHCWVFHICWRIDCSPLTASSSTVWNITAGIRSPPLVLFVLPKACLTSHSRTSGSRLVTAPSWLSRSLIRTFFYSSVYSCYVFLISSAFVRHLLFLSFIVPIFVWNFPLVSLIFLKRSLFFPTLLFSSIFLHCSLKKVSYLSLLFFGTLHSVGYIFPFLLCLSLLFFFSYLFVRPPQITVLPSCIFFPPLGDSLKKKK